VSPGVEAECERPKKFFLGRKVLEPSELPRISGSRPSRWSPQTQIGGVAARVKCSRVAKGQGDGTGCR
jgi:hypothetical protein